MPSACVLLGLQSGSIVPIRRGDDSDKGSGDEAGGGFDLAVDSILDSNCDALTPSDTSLSFGKMLCLGA